MITGLQSLQEWIIENYNPEIEKSLSDEELIEEYVKYPSVKKNTKILTEVLRQNNVTYRQIEKIKKDYVKQLVPPGTKSVVKGSRFNNIIKDILLRIFTDERYEVAFEKNCDYMFSEIPDWYIKDKETNKIVIGYNQLDLWSGGSQINRASKYIMDDNFHLKYEADNVKVLSVVCNNLSLISETNKPFKIMKYGINTGRVCYVKNLTRAIRLLL